MTRFLAAYDVEVAACVEALARIVPIHDEYGMPATFFIRAPLLEARAAECRRLLGEGPLFEVACHSYDHLLLRDHAVCGSACSAASYDREIKESKQRIEEVFGRTIQGFRPPVGFPDGFCGAPHLLRMLREAGYEYTSACLWGVHTTLPAPLREPFTYSADGFPDILEIPACEWHENVLKYNTPSDRVRVLVHPGICDAYAEGRIARPVQIAAEEAAVHRLFIDEADARGMSHVTLVWHPFSLLKFDPDMEMLHRLFRYVQEKGMSASTLGEYARTWKKVPE